MKKFLRWILSVLGYGTYTLAVLIVLLWFLFPTESLRVWLEKKLENQSSSLAWEIGELRIAWPLSLVGLNIKAVKKDGRESLMSVDELKVMPDVTGIIRLGNELPVTYRARMLDGLVSGDASFAREQGRVKCSGEASTIQIGGLEGIWQQLDRKASGKLSGSFSYDGKWSDLMSGDLQADLAVAEGSLALLQPVFGLGSIEFNRLSTALSLSKRIATFDKGKIDSDLFTANFDGTVTLEENLLGSGLDINGSFEPRPELLGSLKDPAVMQLIKGQLRENKLMFTLSDTLLEPGILFQGVSGVIDGLIQGSGR